jgi:hypothetical protein
MSVKIIIVVDFPLGLGKDARAELVSKVHVCSQKVRCRNEEVVKCLRSRQVVPPEAVSPSVSTIIH